MIQVTGKSEAIGTVEISEPVVIDEEKGTTEMQKWQMDSATIEFVSPAGQRTVKLKGMPEQL